MGVMGSIARGFKAAGDIVLDVGQAAGQAAKHDLRNMHAGIRESALMALTGKNREERAKPLSEKIIDNITGTTKAQRNRPLSEKIIDSITGTTKRYRQLSFMDKLAENITGKMKEERNLSLGDKITRSLMGKNYRPSRRHKTPRPSVRDLYREVRATRIQTARQKAWVKEDFAEGHRVSQSQHHAGPWREQMGRDLADHQKMKGEKDMDKNKTFSPIYLGSLVDQTNTIGRWRPQQPETKALLAAEIKANNPDGYKMAFIKDKSQFNSKMIVAEIVASGNYTGGKSMKQSKDFSRRQGKEKEITDPGKSIDGPSGGKGSKGELLL